MASVNAKLQVIQQQTERAESIQNDLGQRMRLAIARETPIVLARGNVERARQAMLRMYKNTICVFCAVIKPEPENTFWLRARQVIPQVAIGLLITELSDRRELPHPELGEFIRVLSIVARRRGGSGDIDPATSRLDLNLALLFDRVTTSAMLGWWAGGGRSQGKRVSLALFEMLFVPPVEGLDRRSMFQCFQKRQAAADRDVSADQFAAEMGVSRTAFYKGFYSGRWTSSSARMSKVRELLALPVDFWPKKTG